MPLGSPEDRDILHRLGFRESEGKPGLFKLKVARSNAADLWCYIDYRPSKSGKGPPPPRLSAAVEGGEFLPDKEAKTLSPIADFVKMRGSSERVEKPPPEKPNPPDAPKAVPCPHCGKAVKLAA